MGAARVMVAALGVFASAQSLWASGLGIQAMASESAAYLAAGLLTTLIARLLRGR